MNPAVEEHPSDMMSRRSSESGRFESPDLPTFQQAFEAAKEEHSKAASATTADADTEQAPPPEASTAAAAKTGTTPEPTADQAAAAPATTATTATGLMSDEEFSALQTKHANDPIAIKKELDRVFTQKTQVVAEERKTYERLKPYQGVIDAFETDADGTLARLAEQRGFSLVSKTAPVSEASAAAAQPAVDALIENFRTALGPELEYLADPLAPAIKGLVDSLTKTSVDEATRPLRAQHDVVLNKAAEDATATVMKSFAEKHPDFQTHEAEMLALSAKLKPNGMDELEYLDLLYDRATAPTRAQSRATDIEKQVAAGVKAALARLEQGAEAAETPSRATPDSRVIKGPPALPTFKEAHEAAKRGERWE